MTFRRLASVGVLVALTLTSCTMTQRTPPPGQALREQQLQALTEWQLRGRIAIKSEAAGGQARMHWQQAARESRMRLAGPFGVGAYDIVLTPDVLTVSTGDGEQVASYAGAEEAEAFLLGQLGWAFPITSVRYWMLGLPDPGFDAELQYAVDGGLTELAQHGWRVSYERYADYDGYWLPKRLTLESEAARVRIVVSDWQAGVADER